MLNWMKKRKELRERRNKEEIEGLRREGEELLDKKRSALEERPCAVNGMNNCTRECVHFNKGFAYVSTELVEFGNVLLTDPPGCKLWRSSV